MKEVDISLTPGRVDLEGLKLQAEILSGRVLPWLAESGQPGEYDQIEGVVRFLEHFIKEGGQP
tara:strand:+ start:2361 stop:2549 length:189 start_codon:yes stop_codon:yes gene_type:complete